MAALVISLTLWRQIGKTENLNRKCRYLYFRSHFVKKIAKKNIGIAQENIYAVLKVFIVFYTSL